MIDGSTSKTNFHLDETESNGRFCMLTLSDILLHTDATTSVQRFCAVATDFLHQAYINHDVIAEMKQHPERRPTASAIIYNDNRKEIWMIGDCQCLINGQKYQNPKPSESIVADKRCMYLRKVIAEGMSIEELRHNDIGRHYIYTDLVTATLRQNIDFPVIDGTPIPSDKIKIIKVKKDDEVILASDGYPYLQPTLQKSEDYLHDILSKDPLCINYFKATKGWMIGNKSFDDRAYIRFVV